jgi:hypothetical protein
MYKFTLELKCVGVGASAYYDGSLSYENPNKGHSLTLEYRISDHKRQHVIDSLVNYLRTPLCCPLPFNYAEFVSATSTNGITSVQTSRVNLIRIFQAENVVSANQAPNNGFIVKFDIDPSSSYFYYSSSNWLSTNTNSTVPPPSPVPVTAGCGADSDDTDLLDLVTF